MSSLVPVHALLVDPRPLFCVAMRRVVDARRT